MAKSWYVLHTFSGHENKVERYLRIMMEDGTLGSAVSDVKVPSEEVFELRGGKKRVAKKRFLPGYVLLEMDMPEQEWRTICTSIKRIQGVVGFVGHQSQGAKPRPISEEEASTIFHKTGSIEAGKKYSLADGFSVGEEVLITEGPFKTFSGTVDSINEEKGRLRVMVGIFGRITPVEVDFLQVERA